MMKRILVIALINLVAIGSLIAQSEEEIVGFDFTYVGKGATGDDSEISIQRYDFRALLPQALKKKDHYLMHSFNYATSNIHYGNTIAKNAKINSFHTLSYNLSLYKPLKNNWYLYAGIGPYVSSNFDSGLTGKELQFSGMILFSKQIGKRKDLEFTWGIFYHPSMGPETPLPLVGLSWTPNEHWNINCGFPEFSINYNFSKNTTVGTNLFITGDEYTLSKSERIYRTFEKRFNDGDVLIDNQPLKPGEDDKYKKINRLSYTDYGVGLHFKQRLFSHLFLMVNTGYTFYRKLEFKRNSKSVFDTKSNDKVFIRAGVSFMM